MIRDLAVTLVAGKPSPTAFEPDSDYVQIAVVMGTAGLRIDIDAVNFLAVNREHHALACAHQSLYGLDQLLRVPADAVLKDDLDFFDIVNICCRISFDHHQIGLFSNSNGTDT